MIINKEDFKNAIKHLIYLLCLISSLIIVCLAIAILYDKHINHNSSPVEIHKIDSVKLENTKLTTEINILDSIKNNKVNDVTKLNNDSTIKLFYQLISTKQ